MVNWLEQEQEQEVGKISKDEVREALKRMKIGNAVGSDDILIE